MFLDDDRAHALLVLRLEEREQEAHCNRFDSVPAKSAHRRPQCRLVERAQRVPARVNALDDFAGEALGDEHRRPVVHHVEEGRPIRPRLLSDLVDGAKAFGYQQPRPRALAFQERVGANRRAMTKETDILGANAAGNQRFDALKNCTRRIVGRRGHLGDGDRAGRLIEAHEIRERAAGIDADPVLPHENISSVAHAVS